MTDGAIHLDLRPPRCPVSQPISWSRSRCALQPMMSSGEAVADLVVAPPFVIPSRTAYLHKELVHLKNDGL